MQRFLDIIFSFLGLVTLAPFLIIVIIILRFTGEREIFYVQKRTGYGGKVFGLLKFATMLKDSPNIGAGDITVSGDHRVLPFGKFLRRTKLNELPQLWNIFIGEMSIVGPRPMVPNTFSNYSIFSRNKLNSIRPGLTGIGSIIFRDEEELITDVKNSGGDPWVYYKENIYPYKGELEIWYQNNKSFSLDIKLIFITAWTILNPSSKFVFRWFKDLPKRPF